MSGASIIALSTLQVDTLWITLPANLAIFSCSCHVPQYHLWSPYQVLFGFWQPLISKDFRKFALQIKLESRIFVLSCSLHDFF